MTMKKQICLVVLGLTSVLLFGCYSTKTPEKAVEFYYSGMWKKFEPALARYNREFCKAGSVFMIEELIQDLRMEAVRAYVQVLSGSELSRYEKFARENEADLANHAFDYFPGQPKAIIYRGSAVNREDDNLAMVWDLVIESIDFSPLNFRGDLSEIYFSYKVSSPDLKTAQRILDSFSGRDDSKSCSFFVEVTVSRIFQLSKDENNKWCITDILSKNGDAVLRFD
jgi:hypothetical protein